MALLLLRNEAACLVPDMKTELVSSRVPPELSRSPLPRERFRPPARSGSSLTLPRRPLNDRSESVKSRWRYTLDLCPWDRRVSWRRGHVPPRPLPSCCQHPFLTGSWLPRWPFRFGYAELL